MQGLIVELELLITDERSLNIRLNGEGLTLRRQGAVKGLGSMTDVDC